MTLRQLIKQQEVDNPKWSGKVFMCYSNDTILRKRALGQQIADGELFEPNELDEHTLNREVKPNQWWVEDNDLCIDFNRAM